MDLIQIENDTKQIVLELLNAANLKPYDGIIIGGSTSEVLGKDLGSASDIEVARVIIKTIVEILDANNIYTLIQACEHINRAVVVEEEYAIRHDLDQVNVIPILSAGGGFASAAMETFTKPVVVEYVGAQAGIDIGDVFIGMHIKGVGVVVRSDIKEIGQAHLSMIRTRSKLIGGPRSRHF